MLTDHRGNPATLGRYVGNPFVLPITSGASVTQTCKPNTVYALQSDVDAFFTWGTSPTATNQSHPLKAGLDKLHYTDGVNVTVAVIAASTAGNVYISELDISGV